MPHQCDDLGCGPILTSGMPCECTGRIMYERPSETAPTHMVDHPLSTAKVLTAVLTKVVLHNGACLTDSIMPRPLMCHERCTSTADKVTKGASPPLASGSSHPDSSLQVHTSRC
eukprot:6156075-Amphidinium_carterae.2